MAHERLHDDEEIKASSNRTFGFTIAVAVLILGALPLLSQRQPIWWLWGVAVVFALAAWLRPASLSTLNRWWMTLGLLLGRIVGPIAMGIMFYLVITPIGLIMRLTGKATMRARFDRNATTYWLKRDPPGPPSDSLNNQF